MEVKSTPAVLPGTINRLDKHSLRKKYFLKILLYMNKSSTVTVAQVVECLTSVQDVTRSNPTKYWVLRLLFFTLKAYSWPCLDLNNGILDSNRCVEQELFRTRSNLSDDKVSWAPFAADDHWRGTAWVTTLDNIVSNPGFTPWCSRQMFSGLPMMVVPR